MFTYAELTIQFSDANRIRTAKTLAAIEFSAGQLYTIPTAATSGLDPRAANVTQEPQAMSWRNDNIAKHTTLNCVRVHSRCVMSMAFATRKVGITPTEGFPGT